MLNKSKRRVFALAIEEKVQWATALVDSVIPSKQPEKEEFEFGTFDDIPIAGPSPKLDAPLQQKLLNALTRLRRARPDIFTDCAGVGVSTIGVVDRVEKRLCEIALKSWLTDSFLVDFRDVFEKLDIKSIAEDDDKLSVHNDCSAKALAEYYLQPEGDVARSVLYLTLDEGVNGGIIIDEHLLTTEVNPEIGHFKPRRHELDPLFPGVCPVHGDCYEGLASNRRLRKTWGGPRPRPDFTLSDLRDDHDAWNIEAYYIAQLCLGGALHLSPERIILGGSVVCGRPGDDDARRRVFDLLFPLIWSEFEWLNRSYPRYKPVETFICPGRIQAEANIVGALQLSRSAAFGATKQPPKAAWQLVVIKGGLE